MGTVELADKLWVLLKDKRFLEAQERLFYFDVSREESPPHQHVSVVGIDNILQKERDFLAKIVAWNHYEVSEPIVCPRFFSIRMKFDVELNDVHRIVVDELIVYEVRYGKIVRERLFC